MIKTALEPLQRAIVARLESDPLLNEIITGVYDEIESGAKLPYVQIGDDTVNPYDTKTSYGEDVTLTLHCYAHGPGKTKAKQIMNVVLQAITATPLELEGFTMQGIEREFLEVYQDEKAYHGICRFRVYIKQ